MDIATRRYPCTFLIVVSEIQTLAWGVGDSLGEQERAIVLTHRVLKGVNVLNEDHHPHCDHLRFGSAWSSRSEISRQDGFSGHLHIDGLKQKQNTSLALGLADARVRGTHHGDRTNSDDDPQLTYIHP